jgi:hypothetical protein
MQETETKLEANQPANMGCTSSIFQDVLLISSGSLPYFREEHIDSLLRPIRSKISDQDFHNEKFCAPSDCKPITTSKIQRKTYGTTKKVTFAKVETRRYSIMRGDHPSCSDELPISLTWEFNPRISIEFIGEDTRNDVRPPARRLSYLERKTRLQEVAGVLFDEECHTVNIQNTDPELELAELMADMKQKEETDFSSNFDSISFELSSQL